MIYHGIYAARYKELCSRGKRMLREYTRLYGPKEALRYINYHEVFVNFARDW